MRRLISVGVLAIGVAGSAAAQSPCTRNLESGFSYCVPDGWRVAANADSKFKVVIAPASPGFTANINLADEQSALPLADVVAANIKDFLDNPQKYGVTTVRVVSQAEFTTASGLRGFRVVFHLERGELKVRDISYMFKLEGTRKLTMTCMASESRIAEYEPICDRAVSTFRADP